MSQDPSDQAGNKPERNPDGTIKPGHSGNPSGRRKQPEWVSGYTDAMWAALIAAGTGLRVPGVESPAADALAKDCPAKVRVDAQARFLDRIHGKPKETVEHLGDDTRGRAEEALVAIAKAALERKP